MTIEKYSTWLFEYGILTILMLLEDFEKTEEYEECAKIVQAIERQERRLDTVFARRIDEAAIREVMSLRKGVDRECLMQTHWFYKEFLLEEIAFQKAAQKL